MSAESATGLTGQQVVSEVQRTTLESPLAELVDEYNERIGIRGEYLWKWLETSWPLVTLDCVPEDRRDTVSTHKTVVSMYITLVDDLGENFQDAESFHEASKIPFDHAEANPEREGVRTDYIRFLQKVWDTAEEMFEEADREAEFRPLLEYDLRLGLMSMDYERLANDFPEMMNRTEMTHYTPHNMMMLAGATIDLMYSPSFDRSELAAVRETVYRSQQLVRISNWASTWERELLEGDFTCPVFTEATSRGIVTHEELEALRQGSPVVDPDRIASQIHDHGIEASLLKEWDELYAGLMADIPEADSVDLMAYADEIKTIRKTHMASKGHK